jgi:RHS repeat-associated protein
MLQIHNDFRNYDPATGRYVHSDPIALAGNTATNSF